MEIREFVQQMEALAPPALAEPCDEGRIGLVLEGTRRADAVVVALDATVRVAERAAELDADVLVVHHPPFFAPMTRVDGGPARLLRVALGHGLHIYAMHTNFDHAPGGINDCLADLLGLSDRVPLGLGLVGRASTDADGLAAVLGPLRVWGDVGRIRRLAVVGGSGFDPALIEEAAALGADAFLSSDSGTTWPATPRSPASSRPTTPWSRRGCGRSRTGWAGAISTTRRTSSTAAEYPQ